MLDITRSNSGDHIYPGRSRRPVHGPASLSGGFAFARLASLVRESRGYRARRTGSSTAIAFMLFNVVIFVVGFAVLVLQPYLPLESRRQEDARADDHLQHRLLVPDQHQPAALFRRSASVVLQPIVLHLLEAVHHRRSIGLCALVAIIRGLRGDKHMGNFYVDMWRGGRLLSSFQLASSSPCC